MLQKVRVRAEGLIAWVIVLMIAAAFALFGLSDYFSAGMNNSVAAEVDGEKISWRAVENYAERLSQQHTGEIDRGELIQQSLSTVIKRVALLKDSRQLGFKVGEQQVATLLTQIPAFQVDGKFSKQHYLDLLKQVSYTDAEFRHQLSQDILLGQLERGMSGSNYLLESELQEIVAILEQKRNFGYMVIPKAKFQKSIKVSASEVQTYYDKNKAKFIKPEQVILEYVELSLASIVEQIHPSAEESLAYYQEHKSSYAMPERVHARHILITAPEGDKALDEKAKEKIQSLSKQIKEGADFAELAKKESQDPGSAEKGGDLGWFTRGQMVPEFEKAVFALKKPNDISEFIRTPYGYHLIQLVGKKESEVRAFEQVKSMVEEQIKLEKAQILFAEKGELMAKLAFEQGTTLAQIAEQFGLKIQETPVITRDGGTGIAGNSEVMKVAFDEDTLKGRNSEPVRLMDNAVAIFHLLKHQPTVQETETEATPQIQTLISAERAQQASKELGEKLIQDLRNGQAPLALSKKEQLNWTVKTNLLRSSREVPPEVVSAAYQISPKGDKVSFPAIQGFVLKSGDYLVVSLNKVVPGEWSKLDLEVQKSYREGLTNYSSQVEYALYVDQVLRQAKVRMSKPPT